MKADKAGVCEFPMKHNIDQEAFPEMFIQLRPGEAKEALGDDFDKPGGFLKCVELELKLNNKEWPAPPTEEQSLKSFREWWQRVGGGDGLPEIEGIEDLVSAKLPEPDEVIHGILHKGSKAALGANSKARKTWTLMDAAISVATGEPWLGFPTTKGRVLYVNFELQAVFFSKRYQKIKEAKGISGPIENLDVLNLRGYAASAADILPKIQKKAESIGYSLMILDPTYKMLGGSDENAAKDMSLMMNEFEKLSVKTGAAVMFASHFSKGNSAEKSVMDRISGSGVFARDPDSIIIMTENDDQGAEDAFTMSFVLRNFKPMPEFVVQWDRWIFVRNDALDPKKLKKPSTTKQYTEDQLVAVIRDGEFSYSELEKQLKNSGIGMSPSTLDRLLKSLKYSGRAYKSELNGKWSLTPSELQKMKANGSNGDREEED